MSKITKAIAALGVVAGLGVAALPLSTYAVESGPVKIVANIDSSISVTADENTVDLGTITPNGNVGSNSTNVTVTTTANTYSLSVRTATTREEMVNVDSEGVIITSSATIPGGAASKGNTFWGVRTDDTASYEKVAATGTALTGAALVDGSATTNVEFGVSVATGFTGTGTYTNDVVFVATAND